ncbi:MAG: ATP-binding protein [Pseudomonadota bacterium]
MEAPRPTLHLLCGKVAAGKSTLAAHLVEAENTILISEDAWLAALFADELQTPKDYLRFTTKLRRAIKPHLVALLDVGISVVLDFQANTIQSRTWMRDLLNKANADHQLHVLMPPDEVCLARLQRRNASGQHTFTVTKEQFHQISTYFTQPTPEEGFNLVYHQDGLGTRQ